MYKTIKPHSSTCKIKEPNFLIPEDPLWYQTDDKEWLVCNDTWCYAAIELTEKGLLTIQKYQDNFIEKLYKDGQRGSPTIDEQDPT